MSMRCKVSNRLTTPEVRGTTPKEEDMELVEDIASEKGVEEHLAEDEDRSSAITMDNRVTSHETV